VSTQIGSWGSLIGARGVLPVFAVSSSFSGHDAPDPVFDVGGAVPVIGPDARRRLIFVPEGQELRACLADQRGKGAVAVADRLRGLGVVVTGGQGQESHLVQRAQGDPDLSHRISPAAAAGC
jgi:hypothetical protein